jgi:hypothetical protein
MPIFILEFRTLLTPITSMQRGSSTTRTRDDESFSAESNIFTFSVMAFECNELTPGGGGGEIGGIG